VCCRDHSRDIEEAEEGIMKIFWAVIFFVVGAVTFEFGLDAFVALLVGVILGGLAMAWVVAHDG